LLIQVRVLSAIRLGQCFDDGAMTLTLYVPSAGIDQSGQFTLHGSQVFDSLLYACELVFCKRTRFFTHHHSVTTDP
jgi:hypothetical protein